MSGGLEDHVFVAKVLGKLRCTRKGPESAALVEVKAACPHEVKPAKYPLSSANNSRNPITTTPASVS